MPKALVTGCEGFVAQYLQELLDDDYEVVGMDIKHGEDFRDYEVVRKIIDTVRPDKIFHLGALTYVPESMNDPYRAIEVNTVGSLNILEAVKNLGLKTKIHLAGTSEEYGDSRFASEPITEKTPLSPLSPYAIGKAGMDYFGQYYARAFNMHIVITRAFNHCGPGRGEEFAESAFAKQVVQIERGERDILRHGNLESIRNYTDVRDIVRAYILAIDLDPGVYNICSEQNVTMQEVLDTLISFANKEIPTKVDNTLYRKADFSFKKPSCAKFQTLTDWAPQIPLETTLRDILEDWRRRLI
jgi:GDP-4-dehydro-6-deoxy-D-mannose reductase